MHVTLLLPGALLPREVVDALAEPLAQSALAAVLARAELVGDTDTEAPAHLAWLAEHLFQRALPLATAPYAYAALAGAAPTREVLWHADPVHLEVARDHLVVTPLAAPPADDEATALIAAANPLAAAMEARVIRAADRWFLQSERPWDLDTEPLAAAMGRPVPDTLPRGADTGRWSRLLTEIQMTWHTHPVNAAREARGEPTINSLWLHGGGTWSPLQRGAYGAVNADAPEWRGAAHAAAVPSAPADAAPGDGTLIVWDALLAPRLMQDWRGWIDAVRRLDERMATLSRASALDVVLAGDGTLRRLRSRPSDRLKFWRAHSLHQVLSE
jgi:hypothetical protein